MNGPNEASSQGVSGRVHRGSPQVPAAETPALNHPGGAVLPPCRKSTVGCGEGGGGASRCQDGTGGDEP